MLKKIFLFSFISVFFFKSLLTAEGVSPNPQKQGTHQEANVNSFFSYIKFFFGPVPLPIPGLGIGYREQIDRHGFDCSLQVSTILITTQVKTSVLYHYYPKPNLKSEFYMGAGLGLNGFFNTSWWRGYMPFFVFAITPEWTLGRQYKNKSNDICFVEMRISWPMLPFNKYIGYEETLLIPWATLNFGFAF